MEFNFEEILELCAIDIPQEKKEEFRKQVQKIIEFYNVLSELKLEDIEPTTWRAEHKQEFREDVPEKFTNRDLIISGFPKSVENFCTVPQVIEYSKK